MRKQQRPPKPDVLVKNAARWNKQWAALKRRNPSASFRWYVHDGQPGNYWLKPALRAMNQEHCCFCDSFPVAGVSNETIEHFRPKSRDEFLHLAYEWTNLYYCCDACQNHKREQWNEQLLHPDAEDFEFALFFVFDFTTGAISPSPGASAPDQERARITIGLYGLDSEERRRNRRTVLRNWEKTGEADVEDWAYRDFLVGGT